MIITRLLLLIVLLTLPATAGCRRSKSSPPAFTGTEPLPPEVEGDPVSAAKQKAGAKRNP